MLRFMQNAMLIVLAGFLLTSTQADATILGDYFEQLTDASNTQMPAISIIGTSSLASNQVASFRAQAEYCSTCSPFYYWEADGGTLSGASDSSMITWTPPTVTSSTTFQIFCTVGDGKGNIATASYPITVQPSGTTSSTAPTGSTTPSGQLSATYNQSENKFYLNYLVNDYSNAFKIFYSLDSGSTWTNIFERIDINSIRSGNQPVAIPSSGSYKSVKFKLEARNSVSNLSSTTPVFTLAYEPPLAYISKGTEMPKAPVLYSIGLSTDRNYVDVSWQKIIDSHYNDNVSYYEVQYADNSSFANGTILNAGNSAPGTNMYESITYRVNNLSDNNTYYFRARATNYLGTSNWGAWQSIRVDIQDKPYFDTSYQQPANGAVGVSKTPTFQWRAYDADGDKLDYYIAYGTSPNAVDWTLRAFSNPQHAFQDSFDFASEFGGQLKPNTTYYWQVMVREDGRWNDYYGGQYIKSPVWSFTTVSTGSDFAITNIQQVGDIKPQSKASFQVTVTNLGSDKSSGNRIDADYIKPGIDSPFWTVENNVVPELNPGQSVVLNVNVGFRDSVWTSQSGGVYDNVLVSGASSIRFKFAFSDPQDVNSSNNTKIQSINYADAGGPVITYFDLRSSGSMYHPYSTTPMYAVLGRTLQVIIEANDDIKITKGIVQYRLIATDAWQTLNTTLNNYPYFNFKYSNPNGSTYNSNSYDWVIPITFTPTDTAQVRVLLYDDKDNMTEKISNIFSLYSNRLNVAVNSPDKSSYKVGETVSLPVAYDHANTITSVTARLITGPYSNTLYDSGYNKNGVALPGSLSIVIPNNNTYVSDYAFIEVTTRDVYENTSKTNSIQFQISPNLALPSPFSKSIKLFNMPSLPTDKLYAQQNANAKFVELDSNGVSHIIVSYSGLYFRNTQPNNNPDEFNSTSNDYYITYNKTTDTLSTPVVLPYPVVSLKLTDTNVPYILLQKGEQLYYSYLNGSNFITPVNLINNILPSATSAFIATLPTSNDFYDGYKTYYLNGKLYQLSMPGGTRAYTFSNGYITNEAVINVIGSDTNIECFYFKPTHVGNIIYFISPRNSELVGFDTATNQITRYTLPYTVDWSNNISSPDGNWDYPKISIANGGGQLYMFMRGEVYRLNTVSGLQKISDMTYTFDGAVANIKANWNAVNGMRVIEHDGKITIIMNGYGASWKQPSSASPRYEVLSFDYNTVNFTKKFLDISNADFNYVEGTNNPWTNGYHVDDHVYIGNNKLLLLTHSQSPMSDVKYYIADIKMMDLDTGYITNLGLQNINAMDGARFVNQNGTIFIVAKDYAYQQKSYQLAINNPSTVLTYLDDPFLSKYNGKVLVNYKYGVPFDGKWSGQKEGTYYQSNNAINSKYKLLQVYPSQGSTINLYSGYVGHSSYGLNYTGSKFIANGKVFSVNPDASLGTVLKDFPDYAYQQVGKLNNLSTLFAGAMTKSNGDFNLIDNSLNGTVFSISLQNQNANILLKDQYILNVGYDKYRYLIAKYDVATKTIGKIYLDNAPTEVNKVSSINANADVAVVLNTGSGPYLAVANFAGDFIPPDITIAGKGTAPIDVSSNTTVTLTWSAADNSGSISKVEVYKVINGVSSLITTITNPAITNYIYTINEGESVTQIDFRVVVYDSSNNSKFDTISYNLISPLAIDTFTADKTSIDTGGEVLFSWSSNGGKPSSNIYDVYYKPLNATSNSFPLGQSGDKTIIGDFDGDGKTDLAVWRPSNGMWYIAKSGANFTDALTKAQGKPTDVPLSGDFDGDGKSDLVVWDQSTKWTVLSSTDNYTAATETVFGQVADVPIPADFDGDGKTDFAVWRPQTDSVYVKNSSDGTTATFSILGSQSGDIPFIGNFDGDGKADLAFWRPSNATWNVRSSSSNYLTPQLLTLGQSSDTPTVADFDGDGKADIAVWHPQTATWSVLTSSSGFTNTDTSIWGESTDVPVAGNYSGSGKFDLAVFRPSTGMWMLSNPWSKLFSETGSTNKSVTFADFVGEYNFKLVAGQDNKSLDNSIIISGSIFRFDNTLFTPQTTTMIDETRLVNLSWGTNIAAGDFATFTIWVKSNLDADFVNKGTTPDTKHSYKAPAGVTSFDWKVTSDHNNTVYSSQVNHVPLQLLTSPALTKLILNQNLSVSGEFAPFVGATGYSVYRMDSKGSVSEVAVVQIGSFTDSSVIYGEKYIYSIAALNGDKKGATGTELGITITTIPVNSVSLVTSSITDNKINLTLSATPTTAYARFEIRVGSDSTNLPLYSITENTQVIIDKLRYNTAYYLEVYPVDFLGNRTSNTPLKQTFITGFDTRSIASGPVITARRLNDIWMALTWSKIDNSDKYVVYRSNGSGMFTALGETTDTTYYDAIASLNTESFLNYKIEAVNSNSAKLSDSVSVTNDVTSPSITLALPVTSTSLAVPLTISATDNIGVTGYCLTETNAAASCTWYMAPPASFTFSGGGEKTLYAFAKDAADNISAPASATTTVTIATTWSITTTSTAGGIILPAVQNVTDGNTAAVTIIPAPGYYITSASSCTGTLNGSTYTTGAITADCTIAVTFAKTDIIFNEQAYLTANPDIADALNKGLYGITSGWDHYNRGGKTEGRQLAPSGYGTFNEKAYLLANPDVAAAVKVGQFSSGWEHYAKWGKAGGLPLAPAEYGTFNEQAYLAINPDIADALNKGLYNITSGWDHYSRGGRTEGRALSPVGYGSFNESAYLLANPDVAAAVKAGQFSSGWAHYAKWGKAGGLPLYPIGYVTYREEAYLAANPDVAAAVKAGQFSSGWEHYAKWGKAGGLPTEPPGYANFSETAYLAANPDVAYALRNGLYGISSGWNHYSGGGIYEGRILNPPDYGSFNEGDYLAANPDVFQAVVQGLYGISSGWDHYTRGGMVEGRKLRP